MTKSIFSINYQTGNTNNDLYSKGGGGGGGSEANTTSLPLFFCRLFSYLKSSNIAGGAGLKYEKGGIKHMLKDTFSQLLDR